MHLGTDESLLEVGKAIDVSRSTVTNNHLLSLLTASVGRLNSSMNNESMSKVYADAIQVAAYAIRIATEGDSAFNELRDSKGLDCIDDDNPSFNKITIPLQDNTLPIIINVYSDSNKKVTKFITSTDELLDVLIDAMVNNITIVDHSANQSIAYALLAAHEYTYKKLYKL